MNSMSGAAAVRMYLDDLTVRSPRVDDILQAETAVREYANDWKTSCISPKTSSFATTSSAQISMERLPYVVIDELKCLGTYHLMTKGTPKLGLAAYEKKLQVAELRVKRVQWMRPPWNLRQFVLASNAIAGLVWCPIGQPHDEQQLRALDLMIFHTMFSANPKAVQKVAKEFFWAVLTKGHALSASVARLFALTTTLRRMRPEFQRG